MAPSICHGVEEQAGYQVCHEVLIFSPVGIPLGREASKSASLITLRISSSTVAGVVFSTATVPLPGKPSMTRLPVERGFYLTPAGRGSEQRLMAAGHTRADGAAGEPMFRAEDTRLRVGAKHS